MDINHEFTQITEKEAGKLATKRKVAIPDDESEREIKKTKLQIASLTAPITAESGCNATITNVQNCAAGRSVLPAKAVAHQSPKKRLQIDTTSRSGSQRKQAKERFIYGNYSQYYGYRNKGCECRDIRLEVFATQPELFQGKEVLDIGCNSGLITMEVAKRFVVKSIVGLDIDRTLINQANKALVRQKKTLPLENESRRLQRFPYNVSFVHGNYVLRDDILLEIEHEQFDVILCLSITKWIHLNFGDAGLKQAFRRMFLQLRSGGKLILEAQPYDNYGRRKKMTVGE
ncbi:probable RNA methyltransferase CG1239, partial [Rhagoletis pomonella]|uniref:probable RNA methyltransferase CG1239 n=1 Tax=Rhagoletis pomonella TaxID=28610 RepID=UPI00177BC3BF